MVRMTTKREKAEEMDYNESYPKMLKKIQALTLEALAYKVFKCGEGEFEITNG